LLKAIYFRIFILISCLFSLLSTPLSGQTKNVLLINTYHWQLAWQQKIDEGFQPTFLKLAGQTKDTINLFTETIDVLRSKLSDDNLSDYLRSKYKGMHLDLIIANDYAALEFTDLYVWKTFGRPQVFAFSDVRIINNVKNINRLGYITPGKIRFIDTLNLIHKNHPGIETVVIVTGKSQNSLRFKKMIEAEITEHPVSYSLEFWVDISHNQLINETKNLTKGTAVLYLPFIIDKEGKKYNPKVVLKELANKSSVPIYSTWDTFIGSGIVGGKVLSAEITGQLIAKNAIEIIQGKPAHDIQYSPQELHSYMFDQNQLDRFGIPPSLLPESSIIINKKDTFWERYKLYILTGTLLFIVQAFLIIYLISNRSKLIRTEHDLRESRDLLEVKVHKRTQELTHVNNELMSSVEKFRTLSGAAFEGIVITENSVILEVNHQTCEMFGYSEDELIGMETLHFVPPDEYGKLKSKVATDYQQTYEMKGLRKDKSVFPMEIHAKMHYYKGRKIRVSAMQDITERKKAEMTIKEREQLYGALFENNISVMLLIDMNTTNIVDANSSACSYYGYSKKALTHMKIGDINVLSEKDLKKEIEKVRSENRSYFNFRHRLADGSLRDVEVFSGPVSVGGRSLICSIVNDISERMAAEAEREKLIHELKSAVNEIKTLQGIVPICSNCKKIRDDSGYWNLLEIYLEKHSDASFSHGVCPECSDKLYGDQDWYIQMNKDKSKR